MRLNYKCNIIKLSDILKDLTFFNDLSSNEKGEARRLDLLMQAGDKLRKKCGDTDGLAKLGILKIIEKRNEMECNDKTSKRTAYIIDSLKHPDEIRFFRQVYGKLFFCFGVFQTRESRVQFLSEKLAYAENDTDIEKYRPKAEELIERDYNADGGDFCQNVRDAFPLSDAFVKMDHKGIVDDKINRIFEAWFGHPYHTPNKDEYGMFIAKIAALRSSDLSRQVGASILSCNGEVMVVGCNEVPHVKGNIKWTGDPNDKRDFVIGFDAMAKIKARILGEIIKRFNDADLLKDNIIKDKNVDDLVQSLLTGEKKSILKGSRVTNIIEFGRVVHAEMTAITESARRGISISNATLYCTTFPCHMCARHIIASGIKNVIYIEPYPKSMAKDLYRDIISVDGESSELHVAFNSFEGIGPNRYMDIFEMGTKKRKDKHGYVVSWDGKSASPLVDHHYTYYREIETTVAKAFDNMECRDQYGLTIQPKETP